MPAQNHANKHQLKPCPICGSMDLTLDNLGQRDDWFVNCNTCEIQLIANYTEAQAVALWNKRTTQPITVLASDAIKRGQEAIGYATSQQGWDADYARAHAEVVFLPETKN